MGVCIGCGGGRLATGPDVEISIGTRTLRARAWPERKVKGKKVDGSGWGVGTNFHENRTYWFFYKNCSPKCRIRVSILSAQTDEQMERSVKIE